MLKRGFSQLLEPLLYRGVLTIVPRLGMGGGVLPGQVLVFKPDRIGDFILATGAIHLLCRELGPEAVTLAVSSMIQPLAVREFPRCRLLTVSQPPARVGDHWRQALWAGWRSTRQLGSWGRFDRLVNLRHHPTLFEDVLLRSVRAEHSFGTGLSHLGGDQWPRNLKSFAAENAQPYPESPVPADSSRELEAHRRVLEQVLAKPVMIRDVLPQMTGFKVQDGGFLLIVPYGSERIRDYPEASMVAAVRNAGLPADTRIVVCAEPVRRGDMESLARSLRTATPHTIELVHPSGLVPFVELVGQARLVIAMESAAAHISAAMDKLAVSVIGGGHYGFFAPWVKSHRQAWLHLPMDCYGCDWQCRYEQARCITNIPPAELASAVACRWNSFS